MFKIKESETKDVPIEKYTLDFFFSLVFSIILFSSLYDAYLSDTFATAFSFLFS